MAFFFVLLIKRQDSNGAVELSPCDLLSVYRCVDKLTGLPIFGMAENLAAARESGIQYTV